VTILSFFFLQEIHFSFSPCDYRSGSILFASSITLISNLSEDQTINTIEKLIKPINNSSDYNLHFDQSAHHIKRTNEISYIDNLFKNLSRTVNHDYSKQAESIFYFLISSSFYLFLI
jgi:predicted PurR-regulated permease PerM